MPLILASTLTTLFAASCGREPLSGPPDLRLAREECAECGMLIMEDRFSAAALVEHDGHRSYAFYDDIGCLLDHEHAEGARVVQRLVHDAPSHRWIDAHTAAYLAANPEKLPTPMGTGIAAYDDREGAERAKAEHGGQMLDWAGIQAARLEHRRARGLTVGSPPK
ncbi:MAG: nitrous oxide reductase accessory protein NosL [Phycisphaerales bacterium]